jgi:hypothetical protein
MIILNYGSKTYLFTNFAVFPFYILMQDKSLNKSQIHLFCMIYIVFKALEELGRSFVLQRQQRVVC